MQNCNHRAFHQPYMHVVIALFFHYSLCVTCQHIPCVDLFSGCNVHVADFSNNNNNPPPPPPVDHLAHLLRLNPLVFSSSTEPIVADDWLSMYGGNIDCASKKILLTTPEGRRIEYVSRHVPKRTSEFLIRSCIGGSTSGEGFP